MFAWLEKLIIRFLPKNLVKKQLGSLIRHALTALGALLVGSGIIDDPEVVTALGGPLTEILTGLAVFLFGLLLSFNEKKDK